MQETQNDNWREELRQRTSSYFAREGYPIIGAALILALVGSFIHPFFFILFLGLAAFSLYFFRNPARTLPAGEDLVVSPADGKVIIVNEVDEGRFLKKRVKKISIFMSPVDVHVNRIPVSGKIKSVNYTPGKFVAAYAENASLDNEQNAIVIETPKGDEILFIQIAGWLARRIISYAKPGQVWEQGGIFGLIRFGSRVDVFVPLNYQVLVKVGDRVVAGETALAKA